MEALDKARPKILIEGIYVLCTIYISGCIKVSWSQIQLRVGKGFLDYPRQKMRNCLVVEEENHVPKFTAGGEGICSVQHRCCCRQWCPLLRNHGRGVNSRSKAPRVNSRCKASQNPKHGVPQNTVASMTIPVRHLVAIDSRSLDRCRQIECENEQAELQGMTCRIFQQLDSLYKCQDLI